MLDMIERWRSSSCPSGYSADLAFMDVDIVQRIFFLEIWLEVDISLLVIQQVGNVVFFKLDGSAPPPGATRNGRSIFANGNRFCTMHVTTELWALAEIGGRLGSRSGRTDCRSGSAGKQTLNEPHHQQDMPECDAECDHCNNNDQAENNDMTNGRRPA